MESAIYIIICMYSFFYGTFTRASTHWREQPSLTPRTVVLHTPRKKRRRHEWEREAIHNQFKYKKARLEVSIIIAKKAIILIWSSSLQCYAFPSDIFNNANCSVPLKEQSLGL